MTPLAWRPDPSADTAMIEERLKTAVVSADDSLTKIASHLAHLGGPRIRPSFVAASALVGSAESSASLSDDIVTAGVSVELVHLGSIYHDDVIDEAEARLGAESVNHRWGDLNAILAGDFLMARASELAASLSTEIAELLAETIGWVCEGQVKELRSREQLSRTEAQYLDAIAGKTAALFSTACRIGALVSGKNRHHVDRLTEFGRSFGLAFQIRHDVADFAATNGQQPASSRTDLAAGIYTMPTIRSLDSENGAELRRMLDMGDPAAITSGLDIVRSGGALATSLSTASEHAHAAAGHLDDLPPGRAVDGLRAAALALAVG